jgi:hypothetical protein
MGQRGAADDLGKRPIWLWKPVVVRSPPNQVE